MSSKNLKLLIPLIILILILLLENTISTQAKGLDSSDHAWVNLDTSAASLINSVNELRREHGLPAYLPNSILMNVAQEHASYMAIAGVTHLGLNGSTPWQRGLAAGYPLAGDLSLGGFYSENITAGSNLSVQDAVLSWQADDPHLLTMLSPNLTEIGAGVVVVGDYVYYVIDCAQPTIGRQSPPNSAELLQTVSVGTRTVPIVKTIVPSTPLADGSIHHTVKSGETLWLIAISYGVKVVDLRKWNNLTETQAIFPGNKLLIKIQATSTSFVSTSTATVTSKNEPFYTATTIPTPIKFTSLPDKLPSNLNPPQNNLLTLIFILFAAIIIAALFVWIGRKP